MIYGYINLTEADKSYFSFSDSAIVNLKESAMREARPDIDKIFFGVNTPKPNMRMGHDLIYIITKKLKPGDELIILNLQEIGFSVGLFKAIFGLCIQGSIVLTILINVHMFPDGRKTISNIPAFSLDKETNLDLIQKVIHALTDFWVMTNSAVREATPIENLIEARGKYSPEGVYFGKLAPKAKRGRPKTYGEAQEEAAILMIKEGKRVETIAELTKVPITRVRELKRERRKSEKMVKKLSSFLE